MTESLTVSELRDLIAVVREDVQRGRQSLAISWPWNRARAGATAYRLFRLRMLLAKLEAMESGARFGP